MQVTRAKRGEVAIRRATLIFNVTVKRLRSLMIESWDHAVLKSLLRQHCYDDLLSLRWHTDVASCTGAILCDRAERNYERNEHLVIVLSMMNSPPAASLCCQRVSNNACF